VKPFFCLTYYRTCRLTKPELSSRDKYLVKIAQDEGGYSGKKPFEDLSKIVASGEDEHSDEIGVHAIQDHKQEQGGAQALLDMDDDTISKLIFHYFGVFKFNPPDYPDDYWFELTPRRSSLSCTSD
jgi:hypothetical protein